MVWRGMILRGVGENLVECVSTIELRSAGPLDVSVGSRPWVNISEASLRT